MRKLFGLILPFFLLVTVTSCLRDDDEPLKPARPVSRLFISTSDYQPGTTTDAYDNVFVVNDSDEEDESLLTSLILKFRSNALGGGIIHYSDSANLVFQASTRNPSYPDTTIHVLSVSASGTPSRVATVRNRLYHNVKGLGYSRFSNQLYAVNYGTARNSIFAVNSPSTQVNYTKPAREVVVTGFVPWDLKLNGFDLLLSKTGENGGVVVYKNFVGNLNSRPEADTLITDFEPSFSLTIDGSSNIRGIAYAKEKDVLVVTDYSGINANSRGRVLVFENFSQYTSSASITPTRVISSSVFRQPVSVSLDDRADANSLYVADQFTKRVYRFDYTQEGDIEPLSSFTLGTASGGNTPVSIDLYTRAVDTSE